MTVNYIYVNQISHTVGDFHLVLIAWAHFTCIVKRTYVLRFYNRLSTPARKSVSASRASCVRYVRVQIAHSCIVHSRNVHPCHTVLISPRMHCPLPQIQRSHADVSRVRCGAYSKWFAADRQLLSSWQHCLPEYRHSHVRHTRRQLRQLSSLGRRAVDQQKSLLFQSPDPAQQRSVVVHQLQHKLHRIPEKKKGDTKLMAVTLLILVRFSNFFHCQILL